MVRVITKKKTVHSRPKKGKLTVIAGPMFAGKTTKLLALFTILSQLDYNILSFKAEAHAKGGMGHTKSHDEKALPVIHVDMHEPDQILHYVGDGIQKVIIDAVHFFPKASFLKVVKKLQEQGIDVYVNGLIYDYRKKVYGPTKELMDLADECIEQFSICVKCGGKAAHTERIAGGTDQSIGTTSKVQAKYVAVCSDCHQVYKG